MIDKIILGTVQFGLNYGINNSKGKPSQENVFDILDFANANGIKVLDTADCYGNSSDLIGKYLHKKNVFDIMTKFTLNSNTPIHKILRASLDRLNINKIYNYSFHCADDLFNLTDLSQIHELKAEGIVSNIGISVYSNDEFNRSIEHDIIDIIQIPFNLLDNYQQKAELLQKAQRYGKIIHVRSIFLQGLFFKHADFFKTNFEELYPYIEQLHSIATKYSIPMNALSLLYPLSLPEINGVIVGVDCLEHIQSLIKAINRPLNQDAINEINSIDVRCKELLDPRTWHIED